MKHKAHNLLKSIGPYNFDNDLDAYEVLSVRRDSTNHLTENIEPNHDVSLFSVNFSVKNQIQPCAKVS